MKVRFTLDMDFCAVLRYVLSIDERLAKAIFFNIQQID